MYEAKFNRNLVMPYQSKYKDPDRCLSNNKQRTYQKFTRSAAKSLQGSKHGLTINNKKKMPPSFLCQLKHTTLKFLELNKK